MKKMSFGSIVYKKRRLNNMSQKELGELIGVNSSTICRIENGIRKELGYILVFKLRKALNLSEPDDGFTF